MNYNRIQQGKRRLKNHKFIPTPAEMKRGFDCSGINNNMHYPNGHFRSLGPNRDWPRRKFHYFKSKSYKVIKEELENDSLCLLEF